MPLSAKIVKDRTVKMSANITNQQIEDLKLTSTLSIADPKEELLGLLLLKGQTRGGDIANVVIECFKKHQIPLEKTVSISTERAKGMTSARNGFVAILKEKINRDILTLALFIKKHYVRTFPEEICKVMELV
ncbi:uncharacterized protein TNCV_3975511 [Trichonephila clavipes]|nr:uncharacterized protein TNCV_3975511 [Trichonephila clavipes]